MGKKSPSCVLETNFLSSQQRERERESERRRRFRRVVVVSTTMTMTTTMVSALWMTIVCGARLVREGVAVRSSSAMSIDYSSSSIGKGGIYRHRGRERREDAERRRRWRTRGRRRRNGRNPLMFKSSGNEDGRGKPTYHTIFSTECNTYFDYSLLACITGCSRR